MIASEQKDEMGNTLCGLAVTTIHN